MILEKIKFDYNESMNQDNLFTKNHVKYDVDVEYNGHEFSTDYQCNPMYTDIDKKSVIECLLSDASCYECSTDKYDFIHTFGYNENAEKMREGEKAYNGCKAVSEWLDEAFTPEELETLRNEIENDYEEEIER